MLKLEKDIRKHANPKKAKLLAEFFKTAKGDYGEGDVFLGLAVPLTRSVALPYHELSLPAIRGLLSSRYHEVRLAALLVLVRQYGKASPAARNKIFGFYLANARKVNNWDLVDLSSHQIVGSHLLAARNAKVLSRLASSDNLWERRIAIVSTYAFIRHNDFGETLRIATLLMKDRHDLIHKAVGWMLREVGKRHEEVAKDFLQRHYRQMPRTMLRYAIERFDEKTRKRFMAK